MLKISLILFCIIFSTTLFSSHMDKVKVELSVNEAPPFFSKDLPHQGMCGEIIYEVAKASGLDVEIVFKPLARMIEEDHNNIAGDPAFFISSQDFSAIIPIALYNIAFFHYITDDDTENYENIRSLTDIGQSKIGIHKGSVIDPLYFKAKGISFETSYSDESLFKKLKLKRIDYVVGIQLIGNHTIKKLFPSEEEDFLSIQIENTVNPIAFMLSEEQENAELIAEKFQDGLEQIIANGIYEKVLEKYYESKEEIPFNWKVDLKKFRQLYDTESE